VRINNLAAEHDVSLSPKHYENSYVLNDPLPLNHRTALQYFVDVDCIRLLAEVNEECGQGYVSSSSDGEDTAGPSTSKSQSRWPQLKLQSSADVAEYTTSAVTDTFAPKSTPQPHVLKLPLHGPHMAG